MEKSKYLRPRTSKVNVKVDSFMQTGSVPTNLRYNSTGLGHGGISGKGNGGNASKAFSKRGYWEF
ncbi:MAG: hypothetical protein IJL54_13375 [Prevotella sp.]|nr:hypothetical protein [Prevotella sp.]